MIDFIGIGAQKSGTTWIFRNLSKHPEVVFPAGKEIHFWDKKYGKGVNYWLDIFSKAERFDIKQGEITPAYAILSRNIVEEIYAAAPGLNIFFVLRNPIDRAWSSAMMALRRSEMLEAEASDQWFLDHFSSSGSRKRGQYLKTIRTWTSIYPEAQFKVLFYDDIQKNPRKFLQELSSHIEIDCSFWQRISTAELQEVVRPDGFISKDLAHKPQRTNLELFLHELYEQEIEELFDFLGSSQYGWLNFSN